MAAIRSVPALAAVVLVAVAAYQVFAEPSPEARARAAVVTAVEAFNDGSGRRLREAFSPDWRWSFNGNRIDRDMLRGLGRLRREGRSRPHVELDADDPQLLEIDATAGTARCQLTAALRQLPDAVRYLDDVEPVWTFTATVDLHREDDDTWRIRRTEVETLSGAPPRH